VAVWTAGGSPEGERAYAAQSGGPVIEYRASAQRAILIGLPTVFFIIAGGHAHDSPTSARAQGAAYVIL
jgi:hypothetical protein